MNATTNEPTGATYRIETLTDMLAVPPHRMGHMITDLALWLATGAAARDALSELGGDLKMPTAMEWHDDGKHMAGVKVQGPDGTSIMEMNFDARQMMGAAPIEMPTPPTTTPEPLSARLATMAEQLGGLADAFDSDPNLSDIVELRSLCAALTAASADAAKLEAAASKPGAGELSRRSIEAMERQGREEREGERANPNADGSPVGEG